MAKFEVGQKVKVNYRGWEGEGIVRKITPENWHHVDMLTGNYAHVQGDFNASDLEAIPTVFQPGDIVRAEKGERAVENKVQHFGSTANTTLWLDDVRLTTWESDGYTLTLVKRPEPEIVLPTKPGWYLGKYDTPSGYITIELLNTGEWVDNTDSRYLKEDWVKALGKLTRLEPVNE